MIEELKYHDSNELEDWINVYTVEKNEEFLERLVSFAQTNFEELKTYCHSIKIQEFSSLSIVYEALSMNSNEFHQFLVEEIERIITLIKSKQIKKSRIEVLEDIDLETIYNEDRPSYDRIINYILSQLNGSKKDSFSLKLLDLLDEYLFEIEEEDVNLEIQSWVNSLVRFAEKSSFEVKIRTREVLNDLDFEVKLPKLTFVEKIKSIFN